MLTPLVFFFFQGASPLTATPEPEPEPEVQQQVIPGGIYWRRSVARRRGELPEERREEVEALRIEKLQETMLALEQAPDEFARARIKAQNARAHRARIAEERQRLVNAMLAEGAIAAAQELVRLQQAEQQALDAEEEMTVIMLAAVAAMPRL